MGSINIIQLLILLIIIISPFIIINKYKNNAKNRINTEFYRPRLIITLIVSLFLVGVPIGFLIIVFLLVYLLILNAKRLNDLNKNRWLIFLSYIPLLNICFVIYLSFAKSVESENSDDLI